MGGGKEEKGENSLEDVIFFLGVLHLEFIFIHVYICMLVCTCACGYL